MTPSFLRTYAPNLAGSFYTIGNLVLLIAGGSVGNPWLMSAALFWLVDGIILGFYGRIAQGINFHAAFNIVGNLCLLVAAIGLVSPWGQIGLAWFLILASVLKIIAPPADQLIPYPTRRLALPWYWARRYPLRVVGILGGLSRVSGFMGAVANHDWWLFAAVCLWLLGDICQFMAKKGGYTKP